MLYISYTSIKLWGVGGVGAQEEKPVANRSVKKEQWSEMGFSFVFKEII